MGCKAISTFLLKYPRIPKDKPKIKQIGAVTRTKDSVSIVGSHWPKIET